jgi:nucleoside phosphorylase
MAAMKAAAPSLGVSAAPDRTMSAPSGPPIQFHHGAERNAAWLGTGGRIIAITMTAVTIVPQMEKNVAHRASARFVRREEFAAAWIEMHAPAAAAKTRKSKFMAR